MLYSIPNIIKWAKISQSLAAKDIAICKAKGINHPNERLPEILYEVRRSVEWKYDKSPSENSLFDVSDYLYSLCGKYLAQAKKLAGLSGGVSVTPIISSGLSGSASIKGFRTEILVGAGQQIAPGQTYYKLNYSNIIEGTINVETSNANVPENQAGSFMARVASYTKNSAVVNFFNDDGNGNNLGAPDGMLLIFSGLRLTTLTPSIETTPTLKSFPITGTQIISGSYDNTDLAGYDLLVYYNGVGYIDVTVKSTGGFTLLAPYAGDTFTSVDKFVITPNGIGFASNVIQSDFEVDTYADMLLIPFPVSGKVEVKVMSDSVNAEGDTTVYEKWADGDITFMGQKVN